MNRRTAALIAAPVVVLALTAGVASGVARQDTRLADAHDACASYGSSTLADGGHTIIIDGDRTGDAFTCYATHLDMDAATIANVGATRALDGTQTGTWDGLDARWTFSPDDGLTMTITTGR